VIEIIREFLVKETARGQLELIYGPGGAWSRTFAQCPGFRGTILLRDLRDPRRYLVIEIWDTEDQREQALAERQAEYSDLETAFARWTESITELGSFRVLAEATVRPRGRAGRPGAGEVGRKSRRITK